LQLTGTSSLVIQFFYRKSILVIHFFIERIQLSWYSTRE